jgi:hypothetical protein
MFTGFITKKFAFDLTPNTTVFRLGNFIALFTVINAKI